MREHAFHQSNPHRIMRSAQAPLHETECRAACPAFRAAAGHARNCTWCRSSFCARRPARGLSRKWLVGGRSRFPFGSAPARRGRRESLAGITECASARNPFGGVGRSAETGRPKTAEIIAFAQLGAAMQPDNNKYVGALREHAREQSVYYMCGCVRAGHKVNRVKGVCVCVPSKSKRERDKSRVLGMNETITTTTTTTHRA